MVGLYSAVSNGFVYEESSLSTAIEFLLFMRDLLLVCSVCVGYTARYGWRAIDFFFVENRNISQDGT